MPSDYDLIPPQDLLVELVPTRPRGGQHVGTERAWVKVTHLPTETIVMVCERTQHRAKSAAIRMIESYLTDPRSRP